MSLAVRLNLAFNCLACALALLLPLSRVGATVVSSLMLLVWLLRGSLLETARGIRRCGMCLAVLLFIAVNLASLLWCGSLDAGLDYISKYRYLLLLPAVATSLQARFVRPLLNCFLAGVLASLAWSYGIFLGFVHVGKGYPENPAPSMSHLDYSMFLAVAALVVLARVLQGPGGWKRRAIELAVFLFITAGLLFNIGRSGQLAFFVSLPVVLALGLPGNRGRRVLVACATAVVLVLASYAAVPVFKQRVRSAGDEVRQALTAEVYATNQGKRIAFMIVAADVFSRHPLLGTGVGDNMIEVRHLLQSEYPHLAEPLATYSHVHNQYLQVATELGIVGLLALGNVFVQLLRSRARSAELKMLAVILASTFLVGFVGDPFFHKQLPLALFSVLAGLIIAGDRDDAIATSET